MLFYLFLFLFLYYVFLLFWFWFFIFVKLQCSVLLGFAKLRRLMKTKSNDLARLLFLAQRYVLTHVHTHAHTHTHNHKFGPSQAASQLLAAFRLALACSLIDFAELIFLFGIQRHSIDVCNAPPTPESVKSCKISPTFIRFLFFPCSFAMFVHLRCSC